MEIPVVFYVQKGYAYIYNTLHILHLMKSHGLSTTYRHEASLCTVRLQLLQIISLESAQYCSNTELPGF